MSQTDLVRDIVRHNSWATLKLIEHLELLAPETIELSAEGTYGSIRATLSHLVRAEHAYLERLTGEAPKSGQPGVIKLDELSADAQRLTQDWDRILKAGLNADDTVPTMRGPQTTATILAQAINHGAEHRAHVYTVLGAHGLQPPALDPFAYGEAAAKDRAE